MLRYASGDLLTDDAEALINTVNCVGVMGKGIALQFKRSYPENFRIYKAACLKRDVKLGEVFPVATNSIVGPRWIINFPTKGHWKSRSSLQDIRTGLVSLKSFIDKEGVTSIAIPPLGAGNGGLAWNDVKPLLEEFAASTSAEVRIYAPSDAKRELAPQRLNMTSGRALIIKLLEEYGKKKTAKDPDAPGVSVLEIQKLMYFASLGSYDLKLSFSPGHYGPYSEALRHQLTNMEGVFLTGTGDGTERVLDLSPVHPTPLGLSKANDFIAARSADSAPRIPQLSSAVIDLLSAHPDPLGVELLASVHWAARHTSTTSTAIVMKFLDDWSVRKRDLFSHNQVRDSLELLIAHDLLPSAD